MMRILTTINNLLLQVTANQPYTTDDDLHENVFIGPLILLTVAGFVTWKVWPIMKQNNIFMRVSLYKYGKATDAIPFNPTMPLGFSFMLSLIGLCFFCFSDDGIRYFVYGTYSLIALFIYTCITRKEVEVFHNLKYALEVWVSTLFIVPVVLLLIYHKGIHNDDVLPHIFIKMITVGNGLNVFTSAALIFAANYFTLKKWKVAKKRSSILLAAQAGLALSALIAMAISGNVKDCLVAWLCYAVILGLCIRFYDMDTTVYSDVAYYEAEVVE